MHWRTTKGPPPPQHSVHLMSSCIYPSGKGARISTLHIHAQIKGNMGRNTVPHNLPPRLLRLNPSFPAHTRLTQALKTLFPPKSNIAPAVASEITCLVEMITYSRGIKHTRALSHLNVWTTHSAESTTPGIEATA